MRQIHQHDIGRSAQLQTAKVTPLQGISAAHCGRMENAAGICGSDIAACIARQNDRQAHFLNEVMRRAIRAKPHIHAARAVFAEMAQMLAIACKG